MMVLNVCVGSWRNGLSSLDPKTTKTAGGWAQNKLTALILARLLQPQAQYLTNTTMAQPALSPQAMGLLPTHARDTSDTPCDTTPLRPANRYCRLAARINAATLSASFSSPSGPHTPLDTSTAVGLATDTASATFPGLSPPASSQPRLGRLVGTCRLRQSKVLPDPPCVGLSSRSTEHHALEVRGVQHVCHVVSRCHSLPLNAPTRQHPHSSTHRHAVHQHPVYAALQLGAAWAAGHWRLDVTAVVCIQHKHHLQPPYHTHMDSVVCFKPGAAAVTACTSTAWQLLLLAGRDTLPTSFPAVPPPINPSFPFTCKSPGMLLRHALLASPCSCAMLMPACLQRCVIVAASSSTNTPTASAPPCFAAAAMAAAVSSLTARLALGHMIMPGTWADAEVV